MSTAFYAGRRSIIERVGRRNRSVWLRPSSFRPRLWSPRGRTPVLAVAHLPLTPPAVGLIRPRAGRCSSKPSPERSNQVHPRARGASRTRWTQLAVVRGCIPRARGGLSAFTRWVMSPWVHPRPCGAAGAMRTLTIRGTGPSLRVRGVGCFRMPSDYPPSFQSPCPPGIVSCPLLARPASVAGVGRVGGGSTRGSFPLTGLFVDGPAAWLSCRMGACFRHQCRHACRTSFRTLPGSFSVACRYSSIPQVANILSTWFVGHCTWIECLFWVEASKWQMPLWAVMLTSAYRSPWTMSAVAWPRVAWSGRC